MSVKNLITKRVEFSASHRCWNPSWDEDTNKRVFGKNAFPMGHGHNFKLEATVAGKVDEQTGMVINIFDLKSILNTVLEKYDHKFLNEDVAEFKTLIPTPENIAKVLWNEIEEELKKRNADCSLFKIRLYETEDLYVDYWKE